MSEQPRYLIPYERAAQTHGGGFGTLLWASPTTQAVRFEAMTRLVRFDGLSILDVGCGRADLLDFLLSRRVKPSRYIGIEAVAALADAAEAKGHSDFTILRTDFVEQPMRLYVDADLVAISGALNTLGPDDFFDSLRHAFDAAGAALVFNFLSSPRLAAVEYLHWHLPGTIREFCERDLGARVRQLDDYLEGDCTFLLTKES